MDFSQYVLSAVVRHGYEAYIDCAEIIDSDTFDDMRDSIIWTVYKNIYEGNNPPKRVTGAEYLSVARNIGYGTEIKENLKYIGELNQRETDSQQVIRAAKTLRKEQIKRDGILKMKLAINDLENLSITPSTSIDELISKIESPVFDYISSLSADTATIQKMSIGAREYINDLLENPRENIGIPSFCALWNDAVGGGYRPGLDLKSARKKQGKSTLAINDMKSIAGPSLRIPVLYLDKEMPLEAGQLRLTSSIAKTPINKIERGLINPGSKEHTSVMKALTEFEGMPVWYANVALTPFDEMLSMIRRWLVRIVGYGENGKINPALIVYDYVKLGDASELKGNTAEHQIIGFQATQLANLGIKYGVPISAYVQSNQENKVSQSDRLSWLCNALTYFVTPTDEERMANPQLGNRYYNVDCSRFGPGLAVSDVICMNLNGQYADIEVLGLKSKLGMAAPPEKNGDVEF